MRRRPAPSWRFDFSLFVGSLGKVEATYYSNISRFRKDRLGAFAEFFAFFCRFSAFSLKKAAATVERRNFETEEMGRMDRMGKTDVWGRGGAQAATRYAKLRRNFGG
ncbi:MAG: hypothetical protein IJO06_03480 [Thermoguttaceae bacterium]|nr:hypothetical protein [Thermoguttaceae bacterium]